MEAINIKKENGYATIQIDQGKVNAINKALARNLKSAFEDLKDDDSVNGILLTGRANCFSAGLDIKELATSGIESARTFWEYYHGMIKAMITYPKPFVCAITGYAQAGATIIALCADYRVMAKGEKHVVGMNEFNMHLQIPELLADIFAYYIGENKAWEYVQKAQLFNSEEALALGLVNQSAAVEEVEPIAIAHLNKMINVYSPVYNKSKNYFRKGLQKIVDRDLNEMVNVVVKDFEDPQVQQMVQYFISTLK